MAWPFLEPVDPDRYELPDYLKIIKEPMDLATVWNNLQSGKYSRSFASFARDMRLVRQGAKRR
jgi:bromodomain-containing factor 1